MRIGWLKLFERYVIGPADNPYMIRWRLIETPWFGVFFHRILRDDSDRHLHDHPWPFTSIMLRSGYVEHLPGGPVCSWHFGDVVRHRATDLHRVTLHRDADGNPRPAWSLVLIGRRVRDWGFQTEAGWIQWEEYLATHGERL